jgi:excisionase family DNA binding protein
MSNYYYTITEIATLLQVSEEMIREKVRSGVIKGIKIGKVWRIPEENLKNFLDDAEV